MAMHIYTSTGWKTINWDGYQDYGSGGLPIFVQDGAGYQLAVNAKIYSSGSWKGFLDNVTLSDNQAYGNPDYAEVTFNPNGKVYLNPGGEVYEPWCQNASNSGQYEIYAQQTGGLSSVLGSSMNTWVSLGTLQSWFINSPSPGGSAIINFTIRHAITGTTVSDAVFELSMNYEPSLE